MRKSCAELLEDADGSQPPTSVSVLFRPGGRSRTPSTRGRGPASSVGTTISCRSHSCPPSDQRTRTSRRAAARQPDNLADWDFLVGPACQSACALILRSVISPLGHLQVGACIVNSDNVILGAFLPVPVGMCPPPTRRKPSSCSQRRVPASCAPSRHRLQRLSARLLGRRPSLGASRSATSAASSFHQLQRRLP